MKLFKVIFKSHWNDLEHELQFIGKSWEDVLDEFNLGGGEIIKVDEEELKKFKSFQVGGDLIALRK